jgi:membrane-bound ClpP family serine protease
MASRRALHDTIADGVRRTWPAEQTGPTRLDPNQQMGDALYIEVQRLSPQNDTQRDLKTQATNLMVQLAEIRALLQAQAIPSLSKPLLIALVLWLVVIFLGFSFLAPANATSTLALVVGALSVSYAVFIILELSYPFAGTIRVPSEPMTNVLKHLPE